MPARPIDLRHLGRDRVICCWELDGLLIDPGPESCLATLREALDGRVPRAVLLTHIHLDHAAATGALVRDHPDLPVYVHERGAPHLVDPSKLLVSAARLYGEENMGRLWGEVVPVPEANLRIIEGGEEVEGLKSAYTPGHASHHVCFFDPAERRAYVGDVGGVHIEPHDFVMAPTPPPDIDLEAWNGSLDTVAAWKPETLGITHFGLVEDPGRELAEVSRRLEEWGALARDGDQDAFVAALDAELRVEVGAQDLPTFLQAAPLDQLYLGLERYWRKRAG